MKRSKSFSKRMTAVILASLMTASLFTGCSFFDNRTSGKEEKPTQQEQNTGDDNKAPNSENKAENTTPTTSNDGNQSGTQSGNNNGGSQSGSQSGNNNGGSQSGSQTGNNNSGSQSGSQTGNNNSGSQSGSQSGNNNGGSQSGSQTGNNNSGSQSGSQTGNNNSSSQSGSQTGNNNNGSQSGSQSGNNNNGSQSGSQSGNNSGNPSTTPPSLEIVQQADADYEEWLAAAMLIGVSMEYPDFEFDGLYTDSETSIESKENSNGVYIVFKNNGKKMALHSNALETERSQAGTKDISTQALGFATFDSVDPSTVRTESMTKLDVDDLEELINQSLLVSVHSR